MRRGVEWNGTEYAQIGGDSVNLDEVTCELLTKDKARLVKAALDDSGVLEKLQIDRARLAEFLEYPHNKAFIAAYQGEICGFIYGYVLMSLTGAP